MTQKTRFTHQETFDAICRHFLTMKGKAGRQPDGSQAFVCQYRVPETGAKCFAGALIPDCLYTPGFEGEGVTPHNRVGKLLDKLGFDTAFVRKLQQAHDTAAINDFTYFCARSMIYVAQQHNLTISKQLGTMAGYNVELFPDENAQYSARELWLSTRQPTTFK